MSLSTPQRWTRLRSSDPEAFAAFEEFSRAIAELGKLTLPQAYRGDYAAATQYLAGQVVTSGGASYLALASSRGQTPASSPLYWAPLALAGSSGSSGAASPPTTQTVLAGAVDANGKANFLSAGSGLTVDLAATTTPVVLAFADGFTDAGLVTRIGRVTADDAAAWSGLTDNETNYLYVERDSSTGALSYGATTYAPVYTAAEPTFYPDQVATGGTAVSGGDNGANVAARGFTVDKSQFWESSQTGTGIHSTAYLGYDFGSGVTHQVTGITVVLPGGVNSPSQMKAQWSSDGASWTDISTLTVSQDASLQVQAFTLAAYTAARYFRTLPTAGFSASNRMRVFLLTLMVLPADGVPWFDRAAMAMKVRTSGAWVAKQRVYVGEAVTAAGAVSSVVTYALRGEYDSGWTNMNESGAYLTLAHNLGISLSEGVRLDVAFSPNATRMDEAPVFEQNENGGTLGIRWFSTGTIYLTTQQSTRNALVYTTGYQYRTSSVYGNYRFQMKRSW